MRRLATLAFLLAVLTAGCTERREPTARPSASPSATSTQTRTPPSVPPLPAPVGLSVLFGYGRGDEKGVFRADLSGNGRARLDIAYMDAGRPGEFSDGGIPFEYATSRDGRYLARRGTGGLWVAPAGDPARLVRVVTIRESDESLEAVVWSADGTTLAYVVSRRVTENRVENRLSLIRRDGTGRRLVKRFDNPEFVHLLGLDLRSGTLYWAETGEGGYAFDLSAVDLSSGRVKRIAPGLEAFPHGAIVLSPDFRFVYGTDWETSIVRYTLATRRRDVLYEVPKGKDEFGSPTRLGPLIISPDGRFVYITRYDEPSNQSATLSISVDDGTAAAALDDPRFYCLTAYRVSPDGRYLWFETSPDCWFGPGANDRVPGGEHYVMELETRTVGLFFRPDRSAGERYDELTFLAWLTE